jgi:hypothetical protein
MRRLMPLLASDTLFDPARLGIVVDPEVVSPNSAKCAIQVRAAFSGREDAME